MICFTAYHNGEYGTGPAGSWAHLSLQGGLVEQSSEAQTPLKPEIRETEAEATQDSSEHTQIFFLPLALLLSPPSLPLCSVQGSSS